MAIDLRGKGKPCYKYKGFAGTVKSIACAPSENLIFSVSLDRHFRVHEFHSKKLLRKDYMQSRLTSLLVRSDFSLENIEKKSNGENEYSEERRVEHGESDEMYDPEHHQIDNAYKAKGKGFSEEAKENGNGNYNDDDGSDSDLEIVEEIVERNDDGEEKSEESGEGEEDEEEEEDKDEGDSENDEYYTESEDEEEGEESDAEDEMFPLADKKSKKRKSGSEEIRSEKMRKMDTW